MNKKILITILIFGLLFQPVFASKLKWIIRGGELIAGTAAAYGLLSTSATVNQVGIDITQDIHNTTLTHTEKFVLYPGKSPTDGERNILVNNITPIKQLNNGTLLFWIRADSYDNLPPYDLARFTVGGPIVENASANLQEQSIQIAYGGTRVAHFPGVMDVKINNPTHELPNGIGIEGFVVTFQKPILDIMIQGAVNPVKIAKEAAAKLSGKKPASGTGSSKTPPANSTKDKWTIID